MNRTLFYTETSKDEVGELDFLNNTLSKFTMNYAPSYYKVTSIDLLRPDLISYSVYNTVRYWWLIMMINGIDNPLSDLELGQILTVPNLLDVYEFYKKYKVR